MILMSEMKKYVTPEIGVTALSTEDVITLSVIAGKAAVDVEAGWIDEMTE